MYFIEIADYNDTQSCLGFVDKEQRDIVFEILFEKSDITYIEKYDTN